MSTLATFFPANPAPKFYCESCDYGTCRKSNYYEHLLTAKHKKSTFVNQNQPNIQQIQQSKFTCENCNKQYKDKSGLWRHKQKCNIEYEPHKSRKSPEISQKLILTIIKQNSELQQTIIEQSKTINEMSKNSHNITNTNTTHNNTFNLHFFLNETCKNALNISDFVSSINVSLSELENTGRRGYIEGISSIIINKLNKLSHCDRPLHCSDHKRETMYIKNDNQWVKETEDKPILKKAIKTIANENIKQINTWRQQHPDCTDSDSNKNNFYLKIVSNSMSGLTKEESDKNYEKIISNVAKQVVIDK